MLRFSYMETTNWIWKIYKICFDSAIWNWIWYYCVDGEEKGFDVLLWDLVFGLPNIYGLTLIFDCMNLTSTCWVYDYVIC